VYIFNLLIVAFVLNYDPALPPAGSGLFGFVLAADFVNEEPFYNFAAFAAM
jgi:hypothetical protein